MAKSKKNTKKGSSYVLLISLLLSIATPIGTLTDMLWLRILLSCLAIAPAIVIVFFPFQKKALPEKIFLSAMLLLVTLAHVFFTLRALIATYIGVFFLVILFWCGKRLLFKKSVYDTRFFISIPTFLFLYLILGAKRYTFLDGGAFPFWQYILPLAALIAILSAILILRRLFRLWACVGHSLLIAVVAFLLLFVFAVHLNYVLDRSEPEIFTAYIEDKVAIMRTRKSPNSYYLVFHRDGEEIQLEVSRRTYLAYEKGDIYRIQQCEGAFGKPYYMSKTDP